MSKHLLTFFVFSFSLFKYKYFTISFIETIELEMKYVFLLFTLLLCACAVDNTVQTLAHSNTVVKRSQFEGEEDRFANIYKNFPDYPVTCQSNCYPPTERIECEAKMHDCFYKGNNPSLSINSGFTIKWLGHASFVVSTSNNQQFLFDPVFDQFDWPVDWGFKLAEGFFRQPAATMTRDEIERTNAVMYSHIHYDHFNKADIKHIGNKPSYLVPLGFAEHFPTGGFDITEMAWYANKKVGDTTIHFVPAHHFSSRIVVPYLYEDNDKALWGGWVLENQGKTLFFAGDTGYSKHFEDIAGRFGSIDVCLLPIASYFSESSPKWYRNVHTTPEDALVAAKELDCKVVIPWGYGNASWQMGDKTSHSALFRLLKMDEQLSNKIPLYILNEGEKVAL